jgi:outer membrane protein OmpU
MKKILLATSALVLSAAAANAQAVRIGGEGRMGIIYERVTLGGVTLFDDWAQENRLQFNFSVTVQADHGLTFGAFTRARMNNGSTGVFSGSRVFVEANNFRLTFGNVDGAIRGAGTSHGYTGGCGVGYVGGHYCGDTAGLLGRTHAFASTGGGPTARIRIDYSFGDTRIALSHDRDGSTEFGIRSRFDAFTVALGYSNRANAGVGIFSIPGSTLTVSGHYNGGTWGVGLLVARLKTFPAPLTTNLTTWSLSGNVELGGGNLYAYIGREPIFFGSSVAANTFGISYGYGLGGGATLTAGLESSAVSIGGISARSTIASVGVAFNF